MTGGAGFSRQASQSFRENYELGKVRPKPRVFKSSRNLEKADSKSLAASIEHRIQRKSFLQKRRLLVGGSIVFLVLLVILVLLLD